MWLDLLTSESHVTGQRKNYIIFQIKKPPGGTGDITTFQIVKVRYFLVRYFTIRYVDSGGISRKLVDISNLKTKNDSGELSRRLFSLECHHVELKLASNLRVGDGDLNLDTGLDRDLSDLLHNLGGRVEIDQTLVDAHLVAVPGVGT